MIACCWLFIQVSPHYVKEKSFKHSEFSKYIEGLQSSEHHHPFMIIEHPHSKTKLWFNINDDEIEAYFSMLSEFDKAREQQLTNVSVQNDLDLRDKKEGNFVLHWDFKGSPEEVSKKTGILLEEGFNFNDFSELKIITHEMKVKK
ncbi:hypothetical protein SCARR_05086 [Pontiella sulfatireligans]|uniref:Uncharacterized protein n=2 Tax=Pontiella sulfatireligans TaxID=2750658 RepID=A0A6C2UV44_9BACT|nr:hypothetical protein SCARR_05086 [Pontiella sulfatireligans]